MMWPTDDRQTPVLLEISCTDWCVCDMHLPTWTWGHQQDNIPCSRCSSWSATPWPPVNWTGV